MVSIAALIVYCGSFSVQELNKGSCFYEFIISPVRVRLRVAGKEELEERHILFANNKDERNFNKLKFHWSNKKLNVGFTSRSFSFSINDVSR